MERDELVAALDELSEEERLGLMDRELGWSHPGRIIQRIIAGFLFALGSISAFFLVLSILLLVGILFNVIFMFGWLIYGGWFYIMTGRKMSVSLRFFWTASIAVHAIYGWAFAGGAISSTVGTNGFLWWLVNSGMVWWIPLGLSVIALACEQWVHSSKQG